MTFEEYRRLCLEDVRAWENMARDFRRWMLFAKTMFMLSALMTALLSAAKFCIGESGWACVSALMGIVSVFCAETIARQARAESQDCLARRQRILDSLHAVEKMFEDLD